MLSLAIIVAVIILELIIPYRKIKIVKKGFWIDLIWYQFLQGFLLQVLIYRFIDQFYSSHSIHLITSLPVWQQFIFVFVLIDFIAYWVHRAQHGRVFLWRIHEVHHSSQELNWLSGSRIHALELILVRLIGGFIMVFLGASESTMYIFTIVQMALGTFQHSNINFRMGFINYIINTHEMHRIHHLNDLRFQSCNFSDKLSIWDWLFGTAYLPKPDTLKDVPFGIGYEYPEDLFGQLFYMFRKEEKK